jgi:hypothetical protein
LTGQPINWGCNWSGSYYWVYSPISKPSINDATTTSLCSHSCRLVAGLHGVGGIDEIGVQKNLQILDLAKWFIVKIDHFLYVKIS